MFRQYSYFLFVFFFSLPLYSSNLAYSPFWLRLLHYKPNHFKGFTSEADGKDFFFSEKGKYDPELELQANVEAFQKDIKVGKLKLHPQCSYPLRYKFLKKELNLNIKDVKCPDFEDWKQKTKAQSVSLILCSGYFFCSAFASKSPTRTPFRLVFPAT